MAGIAVVRVDDAAEQDVQGFGWGVQCHTKSQKTSSSAKTPTHAMNHRPVRLATKSCRCLRP